MNPQAEQKAEELAAKYTPLELARQLVASRIQGFLEYLETPALDTDARIAELEEALADLIGAVELDQNQVPGSQQNLATALELAREVLGTVTHSTLTCPACEGGSVVDGECLQCGWLMNSLEGFVDES